MTTYTVRVFKTEEELNDYIGDKDKKNKYLMCTEKLVNTLLNEKNNYKFYVIEDKEMTDKRNQIQEYKNKKEQLIDDLIKQLLREVEREQPFQLLELLNLNATTGFREKRKYDSCVLYGEYDLEDTTCLKEKLIAISEKSIGLFVEEIKADIAKLNELFREKQNLEQLNSIVDSI